MNHFALERYFLVSYWLSILSFLKQNQWGIKRNIYHAFFWGMSLTYGPLIACIGTMQGTYKLIDSTRIPQAWYICSFSVQIFQTLIFCSHIYKYIQNIIDLKYTIRDASWDLLMGLKIIRNPVICTQKSLKIWPEKEAPGPEFSQLPDNWHPCGHTKYGITDGIIMDSIVYRGRSK